MVSEERDYRADLASVDAKVRSAAVDKIFNSVATLPDDKDAYAKLVDDIFHCYWLCDGKSKQEQLAIKISELVASVPQWNLYVTSFWTVMCREWKNIDRWRINKFYHLMSCFIERTLQFLKESEWNEQLLVEWTEIQMQNALNEASESDSLKLFVIEKTFMKVDHVLNGSTDLASEKYTEIFVRPFVSLLKGSNIVIVERLVETLFEPILTSPIFHFEYVFSQLEAFALSNEMNFKSRKLVASCIVKCSPKEKTWDSVITDLAADKAVHSTAESLLSESKPKKKLVKKSVKKTTRKIKKSAFKRRAKKYVKK